MDAPPRRAVTRGADLLAGCPWLDLEVVGEPGVGRRGGSAVRVMKAHKARGQHWHCKPNRDPRAWHWRLGAPKAHPRTQPECGPGTESPSGLRAVLA